ncbi:hypothetical protein HZB01_04315 [Candidatus Woesearchaeota archaeon]|nr:hypothetical protein [Candidatus Woesearchaeota archaeon]
MVRITEKNGEEISFDFKAFKHKVKKFFSSGEKSADSHRLDANDVSLDFNTVKKFIMTYGILFLILIPLLLSIVVRMQTVSMPVVDDWAKNAVFNYQKNQIAASIQKQYPNLPEQNRQVLIDEQFNKLYAANKDAMDAAVKQTAEQFKAFFRKDNGDMYMPDLDPYHYLRYARNYITKGMLGDVKIDGVEYVDRMLAPSLRPVDVNLHPYATIFIYKIMHLFNSNVDIMIAMFFLPVIFSALAVIPAFFLGRRIAGNAAGFFVAMLVAVHPSALGRTAAGFADTDVWNLFFPVLILWAFVELLYASDLKKKAIYAALTGFLMGFYSFAWSGWWYILVFFLATLAIYILYELIAHAGKRKEGMHAWIGHGTIRDYLFATAVLLVSSFIFFILFGYFIEGWSLGAGIQSFLGIFFWAPISIIYLKQVAVTQVWPNVYTTVAELNPASLGQIIDNIGMGSLWLELIGFMGTIMVLFTPKENKWISWGYFAGSLLWFAVVLKNIPGSTINLGIVQISPTVIFLLLLSVPLLAGLVLSLIRKQEIEPQAAILLTIWFLATIFATTRGVRFLLLFAPGFSVAFGIALGIAFVMLSSWVAEHLNIKLFITQMLAFALLCLVLIAPISQAFAMTKQGLPSINDTWWDSLTEIKDKTGNDTIITSWWDFGHWFKYVADRRVTFDGASQNTPQAHWVGKILLTDNEDEAMGILRMLDCSGNSAFDYILENVTFNDSLAGVTMLYSIFPYEYEKAEGILKDSGVDATPRKRILELTHCKPPEGVFITSGDMVGKSGVWAHFGSWDFKRATMYQKTRNMDAQQAQSYLTSTFNLTEQEANGLYYEMETSDPNQWISPWPNYIGIVGCGAKDNTTLVCPISVQGRTIPLQIDMETMDFFIEGNNQARLRISAAAYVNGKEYIVKKYDNVTMQLGVALMQSSDGYKALFMEPSLTGSMFTRLFYFDGVGLTHFGKLSDKTGLTGEHVIVWNVLWDGKKAESS